MNIMRNDVYDISGAKSDTVRVLAILDDKNVVVISMIRPSSLPYEISLEELEEMIETGEAVVNSNHPPAFVVQPTEKQIRSAEENWKIIGSFVQDEPYCFDPKSRSRFISGKSKETGKERHQIQRLLYRYWAGGMSIHALYPNRGMARDPAKLRDSEKMLGRRPTYEPDHERMNIGEKELTYIREAMKKYYNKHTKYHYTFAYNQMLMDHYYDQKTGQYVDPYPTFTQFYYHGRNFIDLRQRVGNTVYQKDMRGITGSSRSEANGPGDAYQLDATMVDVYLVSKYDRTVVVGRPVLYFVADVFSRMIVGFYIGLESASWECARLALLNTFMNKVDLCKKHGVQIVEEEWPCSGLPRLLVVDNGEMISKASMAVIENLGIEVKNTPAWRPDMKGIVESQFRLFNLSEKERLPGAVLKDYGQRGARDYRKDAVLDLDQLTKIVINFILKNNHRQMEDHPQLLPDVMRAGVPAIPQELWNWGIQNRTGSLRQWDPEDLEVALSLEEEATITEKGIKFKNLFFECDTATREELFAQARQKKAKKIKIAFNPGQMDHIYWKRSPQQYERCWRTRDSGMKYEGLTLDEIDWWQGKEKAQKKTFERQTMETAAKYDSENQKIIDEAKAMKQVIPIDQAKMKTKTAAIRENRKKERERIKAERESQNQREKENNSEAKTTKQYDYDSLIESLLEDD